MALASDPNRTFFRGINQVQTNTYQLIEKKRGGKKNRKIIANQSFYLINNSWLQTDRSKVVRTKDVQLERMDYWTIKVVKALYTITISDTSPFFQ